MLYLAGVIQGLALVTFPAAGSILTSPAGFGFSATQYGAMFLPQVVLAILASSAAPALARRLGLPQVLRLGLAADACSMTLLAVSPLLASMPLAAYAVLLVATAALGAGFGAAVMALNTLAEQYFPSAADRAVLAMNVLLGTGTALAPVLVAGFLALEVWWLLPALVAAALLALLAASTRASFRPATGPGSERGADRRGSGQRVARMLPGRFWLYTTAVLLYGVVETLCGNWATLYLIRERAVPAHWASLALTSFWALVTFGRVVAALLSTRIPARWIYVSLPLAMLPALLFVSRADTASAGVVGFGLAGLACSAFLPLTISFGGDEFAHAKTAVSGKLIAFYQIGYGLAAFGIGPLQSATATTLSAIYAGATVVAFLMALDALLVIGRRDRVLSPRAS